VVGNSEIVNSLQKFVKLPPKNRPHTYLFSGPSGCGKTTLARILANEYGCRGSDFTELDAAKDRNVESMRNLVSETQYAPMVGECRVFLIDEVHELTRTAQETLLKSTEDTPPSTYFILCTTEPDKVIQTIRNRCTQFMVSKLREPEMTKLLNNALDALPADVASDEVFFRIVDSSEGSPRKALVMLEQVLSVDGEEDQLKLIQSAHVESELADLCRALLAGRDWKEVADIYKALPDVEPEQVRRFILAYMKNVTLKGGKSADRAALIIETFRKNYFDCNEAGLVADLWFTATTTGYRKEEQR
jgi:DNA polymerase-3 subunit gamma/tau